MKIYAGCLCLIIAATAHAQSDRITSEIDPAQLTALRGNTDARMRLWSDIGRTDPEKTLHITIHFQPSAEQQADLDKLLADQQNPASASYRKWLTPEQYGNRFGLSSGDEAKIIQWLTGTGLKVTFRAASRNWISLDGSVKSVENAFRTEIHNFKVKGEARFANATAPSAPAAVAPLVTTISGLTDVPMLSRVSDLHPAGANPEQNSSGGAHFLGPDDLAAIYDINPLYKAGFDGSGQNLVIIGASDIQVSDIITFRSQYGLPPIKLQRTPVPGKFDPGIDPNNELEADLDIEWAGAVARNANIIYIYSLSAIDAFYYAISPPIGTDIPGPVINLSYGGCESQTLPSILTSLQQYVNQANGEGITVVAASGDSGPAECDPAYYMPEATEGVSMLSPASVPGAIAVGGTTFDESAGTTYWSATNSSTLGSALSYIPEKAWNDSNSAYGLGASGGGISSVYSRPAWQNIPGVPAGTNRAMPDVAMAASAVHDYYNLISSALALCATGCPEGGTSASTQVFGGMVALLNQYGAAKGFVTGGLGNINPALYSMFTTNPGAFHDVVMGNNIVSCQSNTPDCSTGSYGYSAGPGYDLVTGLGSVDVANLITNWFASYPVIDKSGVVPVYSKATTIAPGEWASIYGSNLALTMVNWNGDFPTVLGNTTVKVDGRPAYLWYVSAGQINFQVPDDSNTGRPVNVVVETALGSATTTVTLGQFAPSFSLVDATHVAGIIIRTDGSGAYGGGTYDIIGPMGSSLGYVTVPAKAGDPAELFGVGFGPTSPNVPAGMAFSGSASILPTNPVQLSINGVAVTPSFAGIAGDAGLYQLNLTIPDGAGTGDVPLLATVGGVTTPTGVVISLQ